MADKHNIPKGKMHSNCRLLPEDIVCKSLYEAYKCKYSSSPFDDGTIESGNTLINKMMQEERNIWGEVIRSTNMTHISHKTWKRIRKLSNDPNTSNPSCLVSANQVAYQLLVNGRGYMPSMPKRSVLLPVKEGDYSMVYPFSKEEYRKGVAILKNNKAAGRDDVLVEPLKNLCPKDGC